MMLRLVSLCDVFCSTCFCDVLEAEAFEILASFNLIVMNARFSFPSSEMYEVLCAVEDLGFYRRCFMSFAFWQR